VEYTTLAGLAATDHVTREILARLRAATSPGSGEQAGRTKPQQGKGGEQHRQ
jgi:hypothetical protein